MPKTKADPHAIPCVKCGYDLRVTSVDAVCPECGTPARHSKGGYRVDGDCLVVYPNANLPARCFKTNHTGAECELPGMLGTVGQLLIQPWSTTVKLRVMSPQARVLIAVLPSAITLVAMFMLLLAGIPGILLLFLLWPIFSVCLVVAAIIQVVAFRQIRVRVYTSLVGQIRALLIVASLIVYCVAVWVLWEVMHFDEPAAVFFSIATRMLIVVFAALAFYFVPSLTAVKHVDGEFWIKGCCPAYLRSCEIERQRIIDDAAAQRAAAHDSTSAPPTAEQRGDANDQS